MIFENYSAINENVLTYQYDNKNVYMQLVKREWDEHGQEVEVPVNLTKQDGEDKYE